MTDEEILEAVHEALDSAEYINEERHFFFFRPSWRHPIKRVKQHLAIKRLGDTL